MTPLAALSELRDLRINQIENSSNTQNDSCCSASCTILKGTDQESIHALEFDQARPSTVANSIETDTSEINASKLLHKAFRISQYSQNTLNFPQHGQRGGFHLDAVMSRVCILRSIAFPSLPKCSKVKPAFETLMSRGTYPLTHVALLLCIPNKKIKTDEYLAAQVWSTPSPDFWPRITSTSLIPANSAIPPRRNSS